MATFNKLQPFAADLPNGVHNLSTGQLVVALTNTTPNAAHGTLSQLTQISYTNLSSRNITTTSSTQTSGTYSLVLVDLVLTASGTVGPFRYVYIYNDSAASDNLIGYYDYGSEVTLQNGESFTIDFTQAQTLFDLV
jgi:hypothetical protein